MEKISDASKGGAIQQSLKKTAKALTASEKAFQVYAENMANAETVGPKNNVYKRKVPVETERRDFRTGETYHKVKVKSKPGVEKIHNPGHPYADDEGFIYKPKINSFLEMVEMMEQKKKHDKLTKSYSMAMKLRQSNLDILR